MDPAAFVDGQDDVRLLKLKLPVTLKFRPDGAINNVFFGRPSFDVPGFDDDDEDVETSDDNDDDDVEASVDSNDDDRKSSEMDTDPANDSNNDNDANGSEMKIDDDGDDRGSENDDSVVFLYEVITLD